MSIHYRFLDFAPETKDSGPLGYRVLETVQETVIRANEWIARSGVRLVNIETIVLPMIDRDAERFETGRNDFRYSEGWVLPKRDLMQVIRVWYTEPQ